MPLVSSALNLLVLLALSIAPVQCLNSCAGNAHQSASVPPCHKQSESPSEGCQRHLDLQAVPNGHQDQQFSTTLTSLPHWSLQAGRTLTPVHAAFWSPAFHSTDYQPPHKSILRI